MKKIVSIFILMVLSVRADTITGNLFLNWETSSHSTVITPTIMSNAVALGALNGSWDTTVDPENFTSGTTTSITINTNAQYDLYTPVVVSGTTNTGTGTRGMRTILDAGNAVQFTFSGTLPTSMSIGFYFRFNGPATNDSPRDILVFQDNGGNFQTLQIYDHTGSTKPIYHAHTQNGTGSNISFNRDQWYWVTIYRTASGGTMKVRFYDPSGSYTNLGESSLSVPAGTSGVHWLYWGSGKYWASALQSVDFDNFIINTNGTYPLGPGGGPDGFPPTLTTSPTNYTAYAGENVTFYGASTNADGYRWLLNGSVIAGANSATYTTNNVTTASDASQYSFVATNAYGSTTSAVATLSVNLIDPVRRVDWINYGFGIPGGIPSRTTIYSNVPAGSSLATVQAVVDACPSNQVVKLAAGTYTWPAGQDLSLKSYVTLRGDGVDSTIISSSAGSAAQGFVGGVTIESDVLSGSTSIKNISSGATKGSTNVVLSSAESGLRPGFTMIINQTNDGVLVYNGPAQPGGFLRTDITPEGDGLRCMNQRVLVTATNGTTITFWPPLMWTMTNNPHIFYETSSSATRNYVSYTGIEDLTVTNTAAEGTCIGINRAAYCWVKNVKTRNAAVYHIATYRGYRCELRHNFCDSSADYTSSHGYVIALEYQCSSCLVEDNIVVNTRQFIEANSGSSCNVFTYNYATNNMPMPGFGMMQHAGGSHSAHPMMNLYEGNVGYKLNFDFYWGSSSHNTIVRNWIGRSTPYANQLGAALVIDENSSLNNVLGNVFAYSGINSITNWTTRSTYKISSASMPYDRNWASIRFGYYSDGDVGGGTGQTNAWNATLVGGNYDYTASTRAWINPSVDNTIPSSYAYASKPSFFGTLSWPPIDSITPTIGEQVIPAGYRFATGNDPVLPPEGLYTGNIGTFIKR